MIKYIATIKEWHDKVNGNSYFSTNIEDIQNDKNYILPMQYGYGDQSEHETKKVIKCFDKNVSWNDIRFIKIDKCLKREVKEHGQGLARNFIVNRDNDFVHYYYQD